MFDHKNIKKNNFKKIVLKSNSKSDIARILNLPINKWGFNIIDNLLDKFNINTNHFDKNKWHKRKYPIKEKTCPICANKFTVSEGSKKRDKKFCTQKCANSRGVRRKEKNKCLVCKNKVNSNRAKFCSPQCNGRHHQLKTFEKIKNGTYKRESNGNGKNQHFKLYLIEKFGYKCMLCKRKRWMGKPIPLQVDHKDGNSENDKPDNLRNLCPNCHAQTDTYCGKNKGKGKRKHRLEDYRKGKKKW